ncbi:MAG TPA: DUF979 family protein [Blastocatellia bacterium]|jgi:uncharacterized membrane protein
MLELVYVPTGLVLLIFAALTLADRGNPHRVTSAIFWLILASIFALGGVMPHWLTGLLVLAMVAIDGAGRISRGSRAEPSKQEQVTQARRLGHKIFLPVLAIPVTTFAVALVALAAEKMGRPIFSVTDGTLIGLGLGGIIAMVIAVALTGGKIETMMQEGRRLNDAIGAVAILPQLLASLGIIFTAAGVGNLIATGIKSIVPGDSLFLLVLVNCMGMSLFTIVMGNSFAAFPVIASGVLVPLIIEPFGVNAAMAGILTLTAGSSGTLMTPMAANFNIVPTALLNMRDTYGVIKFQLPFALAIWTSHVLLMWLMIKAGV